MAMEGRYVGTFGSNQWSQLDYNCSTRPLSERRPVDDEESCEKDGG